ncbi:MAG: hypothetical protein QW177_09660 [Candidatus Nitrosotenuis sp.]
MKISQGWVQALWSRYKKTGTTPVLSRPARRPVLATPQEKELICKAWRQNDAL